MKQKSYFNQQFRQFKALSKHIQLMIEEGSFIKESKRRAQVQLKQLFNKLQPYFGQRRLRRVLGTAVFVLGLAQVGHAQVTFTGPITNPFGLNSGGSFYIIPELVDMDGDGDLDIITNEEYSHLTFYENTGSQSIPQFAAPQVDPFNIDTTRNYTFVTVGDLDNDGDIDIIAGGDTTGFMFIENIGTSTSPNFAPPALNVLGLDTVTTGFYLGLPHLVDIDLDGDLDILVGSYYNNLAIHYLENSGTASNPHFEAPINNPFGLTPADYWISSFADLDQDGDLDLLAGVYQNVFYQENVGTASNPLFTAGINSPFGVSSNSDIIGPTFGDLDGDGDLDLLFGEYGGNFVYYINETPVGVNEAEFAKSSNLSISPNPANDFALIQAQFPVKEQRASIQLLDLVGNQLLEQEVELLHGQLKYDLDLNQVTAGVYFVQIQVGTQRVSKKLVVH